MNKNVVLLIVLISILAAGALFLTLRGANTTTPPSNIPTPAPQITTDETVRPTDEAAELAGFNFILDFIEASREAPDTEAALRAYELLSFSAKSRVSEDSITEDLASFIGVENAPEQGASVEDLQISGNTASLIVGLNYVAGRTLRSISMIVENGEWKVNSIDTLDEYPPENN